MTNEELERAVERLNETADWTASGDPGADGSVLLVSSVAAAHSADIRLLLSERAELLAAVERMRGALELAEIALVTIDNYRVTDLTAEQFDAHLKNGVPRDRLEFMTDYSAELLAIGAALTTGEGK